MNISIIGYGAMGSMLAKSFAQKHHIHIANRNIEKLKDLPANCEPCKDNKEAAEKADILFVCTGPYQIKEVFEDIKDSVKKDKMIVSLNEAVSFEMLSQIIDHKIAKVIPNLNGKIKRSETLVAYNDKVTSEDKDKLKELLSLIGNINEMEEDQLAIASDFVGCMPGFIAAIFDIFAKVGEKYTDLEKEKIITMILNTVNASSELMIKEKLDFTQVVKEVATPGGITMEGTKVLYEQFPAIVEEIYEKTLNKGKSTANKIKESF
ncbi:MAG: NAD(P)-binding domain-containing protein [Erysipelotrichaceae bacterium]|nr:NAD(P)-binding domain-containing protein [Erysipelotrichaceae bacterium]